METAYDGRQVVGMDLHRCRSALVRMTEDGGLLGLARITNSSQQLGKEIARAGTSPKVVLEARTGGIGRRTPWPRPGPRCIWRIRSGRTSGVRRHFQGSGNENVLVGAYRGARNYSWA